MKPVVLFVDGEPDILASIGPLFRDGSFELQTAESGAAALATLEATPPHVIVSDQCMPDMSGVDLLSTVRERWPDVIRILITSSSDMSIAVDAIKRGGVYRLVTKPWSDDEIRSAVKQALDRHMLKGEIKSLNILTQEQNVELRDMHQNIEREVKQRTEEMRQQNIELNEAYLSTILALVGALDMEHGYDKSQSERVGKFAQMIGRRMGVEEARIQRICIAATLHDIGTLAISREMLHKPGPLTAEEAREMRRHPLLAVKMLDSVPWLRDVMPLIRHHHEWYNGDARGYPDNIKGDAIDLGARIIHVADAINAMTSHRPYRKTYSPEKVKEQLRKSSGTQFDPQTVGCAVGLMEEMGEEFLHLKPRKHQEIS